MERLTKDPNHRSMEEIEHDLARIREEEIRLALEEVPTNLLWDELNKRYSPENIGSAANQPGL